MSDGLLLSLIEDVEHDRTMSPRLWVLTQAGELVGELIKVRNFVDTIADVNLAVPEESPSPPEFLHLHTGEHGAVRVTVDDIVAWGYSPPPQPA